MEVSTKDKATELSKFNITENHYGDIIVKYYTTEGHIETGYICDYQWGSDDADAFCLEKW